MTMYKAFLTVLKCMMPLMACGAIGGLICFEKHYLLGWAIGWTIGMFFFGNKWLRAMKTYCETTTPLTEAILEEIFSKKGENK